MNFAKQKIMKISSLQNEKSESSNEESKESLPKRKTADSFESVHENPTEISELFWT